MLSMKSVTTFPDLLLSKGTGGPASKWGHDSEEKTDMGRNFHFQLCSNRKNEPFPSNPTPFYAMWCGSTSFLSLLCFDTENTSGSLTMDLSHTSLCPVTLLIKSVALLQPKETFSTFSGSSARGRLIECALLVGMARHFNFKGN